MRKQILTILFTLLSFTLVHGEPSDDLQEDYILIVNTYTESSPWSRNFIMPIYNKLSNDNSNAITAFTEHLNALIVQTDEQLDLFKQRLFSKYSRKKAPKLVVFLGNTAYALLVDDILKEWGADQPMLLCAETDFLAPREAYLKKYAIEPEDRKPMKEELRKHTNLTVLCVPEYIEKTIRMMEDFIPGMNELLFLSDQRYLSRQNQREIQQIVKDKYPNLKLKLITAGETDFNSLVSLLSKTGKQTGILFFSWFEKDLRGNNAFVISTETYRTLSVCSSLPIFALNDIELSNNGMLGGYGYTNEEIARKTMETINLILAGTPLNKMVVPNDPCPIINYPVLLKKDLPLSMCAADTFFYLKPPSFWVQYKYQISIGGTVLLFLLLLLLLRINALNKSRALQQKQINLMRKYSALIKNMPISFLKIQLLFDASGDPEDYIIMEVNPEFEKQLNILKENVVLKGSAVFAAGFPEFINMCKIVYHQKKKINTSYYHKETDRHFNLFILLDNDPGCIDVFMVDATEQIKMQQLLRTVNNKLFMSLDVADITPWKWDLKKKTILCDINKPIELNAVKLSDDDPFSVPDHLYFSKIHKDDRLRVEQSYKDLISGKIGIVKEEYRVYNPQNKWNKYDWVEAHAIVEKRDANGNAISLIGSSLITTERKKIEEELIHAKDKAEESNRLKSAFLANMSHEIRTPLNAIVGFSAILANIDEKEEKEEYVDIIESNNTLLLQLISDILDLSKIEAGTLDFNYSCVDVNLLLRELEQSIRLKASDDVTVIFEKQQPDCIISSDKNRISQVLINLLTNALKFTERGSISFGYFMKDPQMIQFYVTDSGCGIPKDKQDKVFDRFIKLNNFAQGTGLGLSICQTIVQYMGGQIGVDSEEGKGSTFWFTLPYIAATLESKVTKEFEKKVLDKNKIVILVAEDNSSNFKLFNTILKNEYNIVHAWNGREAVELFKQYQPHIVLMDINMPEMNGYEATEEIRKISKDVPIIAVTAYAFASDEQQIMQCGFDAYTAKPLNASELKQQIVELLGKRVFFI